MTITLDTNFYVNWFDSYLNEVECLFCICIKHLGETSTIALDDEEYILSQCKETLGAVNYLAFEEIITAMIVNGIIKSFPIPKEANLKKWLRQNGLPNKDHKIALTAISAKSSHLITEDIDLFEPKAKRYNAAAKNKIKKERSGSFSKAIRKSHRVNIVTAEGYAEDFSLI